MTATVTFKGPEDARVLSAEDFAKVGVEGFRKRTFLQGEKVEVADDVAIALAKSPLVYGRFDVEGVDIDASDIPAADEEITIVEPKVIAEPAGKDADWVEPVQGTEPANTTATPKRNASTRTRS